MTPEEARAELERRKAARGAAPAPAAPVVAPAPSGISREAAIAELQRRKAAQPAPQPSNGSGMGTPLKGTQLDPQQEQQYRSWLDGIGMTKANGFNMDDNYTGLDYDLRGFYKKNGPKKLRVGVDHFPDEFKLPNHETFSNESRYATGADAAKAGRWEGDTFIPPQRSNGSGMGPVNPMVEMGQRAQTEARAAGADFSARTPKVELNPNTRATPAIDREFYTSGADKRGWRPEQYAAVKRAKAGSQDAADLLALRSWENSSTQLPREAPPNLMELEQARAEAARIAEINRPRSPLENFVGDVAGDLAAPFQQNESLRTVVGAPLQFGQGLGQGAQNLTNNLMAVGTDARNSVLNQFDPGREQSVAPRVSLFDQNALLDEGGLLSSEAGIVPRAIGQFAAVRSPLGKAMPYGGIGQMAAKDALSTALTSDHQAGRLSDMISGDTPVIGGLADQLRTREGDPAIVSMLKNLGEDFIISGAGELALRGGGAVADAARGGGKTPTNAGLPMPIARAPLPEGINPLAAQNIRNLSARGFAELPESIRPPVPQPTPRPANGLAPQATPPSPVQTATAAPAQPVVNAPPVAAGSRPPPPAAQAAGAPPPGTLTPVGNGFAVDSFNNLPVKTREGIRRAMKASGMNDMQINDAIRGLNDLPPERANQFEFELIRRYGGPDNFPDLEANLTAMGSDFAMQTGRKGGSPQKVMNNSLLEQAQSEGEYLTRMAENIFGEGKVATKQELEAYRNQLGGQYRKQLAEVYPGMTRLRNPQKKVEMAAQVDAARNNLKEYLLRPEVMNNVPDWVRQQVMLQVSDDLRWLREDVNGALFKSKGNPELDPLFSPDRQMTYSPTLWNTLVDMYPTQVAHSLQSAYRSAIDEAFSGVSNAVDRTTAKRLMRMRGQSKVRANASDPNKRGFGLLHLLEEASPGYKDIRQKFGDVVGAQKAADMPDNFFRIAKDEEALADFVDVYDNELTDLQREAVRNGITTQIRQALKNKTEFTRAWELDAANRGHLPNLTAVSSQTFLEALPKVFGDDGVRMADAIRLSRANIDNIGAINKNFASGTPKGLEIQKNARNLYENPSATNLNPIDATTSTLSGVGALSAATGNVPLSATVLGGAAARALYRAYKNGKSLSFAEKEALADWLFKPRRAGDAAPPTQPRGFSKLGYVGNVATGAGVGAATAAASGQDPTTGAIAGAGVGAGRAALRSLRARSSLVPSAPGGGASRPRRPLPLINTNATPNARLPNDAGFASPSLMAAIVGGGAGAAAAPDMNGDGKVDALERAIMGTLGAGAGGGIAEGASRMAKGRAPRNVPAAPPPPAPRPTLSAVPDAPRPVSTPKPQAAPQPRSMPTDRSVASTTLPDGRQYDVRAEVFKDRDAVVMSPSWPTNVGEDLADALQTRKDNMRPRLAGTDGKPMPEPRQSWAEQNPKEWGDVQRQVGERFIGLTNSTPGPVHVLALIDGVDVNGLGTMIERNMPKGRVLLKSADNGEFALVDKRWLRDNEKQFERWTAYYPSFNQEQGLLPPPPEWATGGAAQGKAAPVSPMRPKPPAGQAPMTNDLGGTPKADEADRLRRAIMLDDGMTMNPRIGADDPLPPPVPSGPPRKVIKSKAPPRKVSPGEQSLIDQHRAASRDYNRLSNKHVMRDDREAIVKPAYDRMVAAEQRLMDHRKRTDQWRGGKARLADATRDPKKAVYVGAASMAGLTAIGMGMGQLMGGEKKDDKPPNPGEPGYYWSEVISKNRDEMVKVQRALDDWGFWDKEVPYTGGNGKYSKAGVRAWRVYKGKDPDGPMTRKDLAELLAGPTGYVGDGGTWGENGKQFNGYGEPVKVPQ